MVTHGCNYTAYCLLTVLIKIAMYELTLDVCSVMDQKGGFRQID